MKEIVRTIVEPLVENVEAVEITETTNGNEVFLELKVSPDDMGRVIGRKGRIAKAIRTVLKSAGIKADKYVTLNIVE